MLQAHWISKYLGVVVIACTLTACTAYKDPRRSLPEGSKVYRMGYLHGCYSGLNEFNPDLAYYRKDRKLFNSDEQYHDGWEIGFNACYERERQFPTMVGGNKRH
ncbi:MAG: hypothetical protein OEU36_16035 [Gammaproteobacteria bacterium]|nr:hypothetical protein [Gammaproteobacteria bacterium]